MANEFGNVGAIGGNVSDIRLAAKKLEVGTNGTAEWEAFYGGHWRDISGDFHEDQTKDGNTITRCIRWDDGFRSYRNDRGLIIRKKNEEQEVQKEALSPGEDILHHAGLFGKSFAYTAGVSLGVSTATQALGLSTGTARLAKRAIFLGSSIFDDQLSAGEKLKSVAESGAQIALLSAVPNKYKAIAIPAYYFVRGILSGQSISESVASTLGGSLGVQTAGKIYNSPAPPTNKPNILNTEKVITGSNFMKDLWQSSGKAKQVQLQNLRAARSLNVVTPHVTVSSLERGSKVSTDPLLRSKADSLQALGKLINKRKLGL